MVCSVCVHIYVSMDVEAQDWHWESSSIILPPYSSRENVSTKPELADRMVSLVSLLQRACLQGQNLKRATWYLHGSSCMHGKYFNCWATSPVYSLLSPTKQARDLTPCVKVDWTSVPPFLFVRYFLRQGLALKPSLASNSMMSVSL